MKKLLLLALIVTALFPLPAEARPGALDASFGIKGKSIWGVPPDGEGFVPPPSPGLAKLPDGGSVAVAGDVLIALRSDGRPESRFGGGRVQVTTPTGAVPSLVDVAVDANGRVLVVGVVDAGDSFAARYTPEGQLDPSFGQGGVLRTDFGMAPPSLNRFPERPEPSPTLTQLNGVALEPDGRIVLSGARVRHIGPCRGTVNVLYREAFVVRLLEGGEVDAGFGRQGAVFVPGSPAIAPPLAVPGASEALYVMDRPGGSCNAGSQRRIISLGPSGTPEGSFVVADVPFGDFKETTSMTLDRQGRILVAEPSGRAAVVRRLAGGGLDPSFGKNGAVKLRSLDQEGFVPSAIEVDRTGKIVVAGVNATDYIEEKPRRVLVGRLTARGDVDRRFGNKGWTTTRFGGRSELRAPALVLDKGGKVLLASEITRPTLPNGKGLAFARYLGR